VVTAARALDAAAIVEALFRDVQSTVSGPCQDDATVVVLGIR
jgi:hypothetical protein